MQIDRQECHDLGMQIGETVRDYLRGNLARIKVFTVLNAMAVIAGHIIAGSGADASLVRDWFVNAVDQAVDDSKN